MGAAAHKDSRRSSRHRRRHTTIPTQYIQTSLDVSYLYQLDAYLPLRAANAKRRDVLASNCWR